METNKFGETVGDVFGTIAWLWVFHRFRQDGAVLLGFRHPWEHGHDDHAPSHSLTAKPVSAGDVTETWQKFSERATQPGDDDDDDDDDDDVSAQSSVHLVSLLALWSEMAWLLTSFPLQYP
jgi:hypothetical protein